jgi:hypothetical protein
MSAALKMSATLEEWPSALRSVPSELEGKVKTRSFKILD